MKTQKKATARTEIEAIAREHLGIDTLQTQGSDGADFHDLAVWTIDRALAAAYEAGRKSAEVK